MNKLIAATLAVLLAAAGTHSANADEQARPAGIALIDWSKFNNGALPDVTVRITPALLLFFESVASEVTKGLAEAQGISDLIAMTHEIKVIAFEDIEDPSSRDAAWSCVDLLEGKGWEHVIHTSSGREKDETVDILILPRANEAKVIGIVILAIERDEVAFVNIAGEYPVDFLGKQVGSFIQLVRAGKIDLDALLDLDFEDLLKGLEEQPEEKAGPATSPRVIK